MTEYVKARRPELETVRVRDLHVGDAIVTGAGIATVTAVDIAGINVTINLTLFSAGPYAYGHHQTTIYMNNRVYRYVSDPCDPIIAPEPQF